MLRIRITIVNTRLLGFDLVPATATTASTAEQVRAPLIWQITANLMAARSTPRP